MERNMIAPSPYGHPISSWQITLFLSLPWSWKWTHIRVLFRRFSGENISSKIKRQGLIRKVFWVCLSQPWWLSHGSHLKTIRESSREFHRGLPNALTWFSCWTSSAEFIYKFLEILKCLMARDFYLQLIASLFFCSIIYNVVLVSPVQQSESVLCTQVSPPSWPSPPNPTYVGHRRAPSAPCARPLLPTIDLFYTWHCIYGAFQVTQWAKTLSAMQAIQATQVSSLGREDTLKEGMATHSSILAWRIPLTEESGRLWSMGLQRVRHDGSNWACTHFIYKYTACIYVTFNLPIHSTIPLSCPPPQQPAHVRTSILYICLSIPNPELDHFSSIPFF